MQGNAVARKINGKTQWAKEMRQNQIKRAIVIKMI